MYRDQVTYSKTTSMHASPQSSKKQMRYKPLLYIQSESKVGSLSLFKIINCSSPIIINDGVLIPSLLFVERFLCSFLLTLMPKEARKAALHPLHLLFSRFLFFCSHLSKPLRSILLNLLFNELILLLSSFANLVP